MLKKIFLITIFLFCFSSCSLFRKKVNSKPPNIKKSFKSLCLSGEGKGRVSFLSGQYPFDFESELEDKTWSIGLSLPFGGEELLVLGLTDLKKVKAHGSFYDALLEAINDKNKKGDEEDSQRLDQFLVELVRFISFSRRPSSWDSCTAGKNDLFICSLDWGKISLKIDKESKLSYQVSRNGYLFTFIADLKKQYFSRLKVHFQKEDEGPNRSRLLGMEMFFSRCSLSK